ncbi:MAG: undecaprenyl diphosphate synthase family protein [Actinomycetota bacterium]|nr:undecaprenyl diphosphate synthase family protein [Actinomycetota bacterium]
MSVEPADPVLLHHVIVVGGTLAEWAGLSDEQWSTRLTELGKVADHVGARWLVLRPYGPSVGLEVEPTLPERSATVGSCSVVAQPDADGRRRLARAAGALQASGSQITEATISAQLNAPATVDPDLAVVLAPSHRMPPSLVWELAYSELVFVDTEWQYFGPQQLDEAMASYAHRHRRFGGVD